MRAFPLIVSFLLLAALAQGQPAAKLYGYVQTVSAGMAQRGVVDEQTGGEVPATPRQRQNYYIYLALPKGQKGYPSEIWIKGTRYAANYQTVKETPVEITNPNFPGNARKVTLVPKTGGVLLSLTPITATEGKGLSSAKTKAAANDLVVVYKMKGKTYTSVLKTLSRLEPVAMQ